MSQKQIWKEYQFIGGILFLLLYWYFGYDGITFSDDVTYLKFGQSLWSGEKFPDDSHFGHRWGAFVFSGLLTFLLGFSDKIGSIASLAFVLGTFLLLYAQLNHKSEKYWFTVFFCTQVYFLHFVNKVYPDPILAFWICLVPVAATYRSKYPFLMALTISLAFIIGFSTKEMMVFLIPFPIILFILDWRNGQNLKYHFYFITCAVAVLSIYFSSYYFITGEFFSRLSSVNEGHYISEFTYADKGISTIAKRLTYLPLVTFVERSYWIWLVMAIPGIIKALKTKQMFFLEMALLLICLFTGFWFMSSTLEFYNPIYLNPRHLVILVPVLAVMISFGFTEWKTYKLWTFALLLLGALISLAVLDYKMALYLIVFASVFIFWHNKKLIQLVIPVLLLGPVLMSIYYQKEKKNYNHFKSTLNNTILKTDIQKSIIINNFVFFSKKIILDQNNLSYSNVKDIQSDVEIVLSQEKGFKLFIYKYYLHAYPEEDQYLQDFRKEIENNGYTEKVLMEDNWIVISQFSRIN
ncbi:MAG: hypothetical protein EA341_04720 [Mongoliibacter sp.]|uniref:hypothetical protein n=1 Tax=Mongoliibacter sp. TaxID=2022438 RepID=UPI0012F0C679|nr:hypothetical protein [Mongoliibacter sp.]TVP51689.1 MAG: hypothetical protein EA341_04720 [Mongoliibacter sp.]